MGHNDMPLMDMVDPPLTTIHIHHGDMGRQAAELLLKRIVAPDAAPVIRVIGAGTGRARVHGSAIKESGFQRRNLIYIVN